MNGASCQKASKEKIILDKLVNLCYNERVKGGGAIQNLTNRPNDGILDISLYEAVDGVNGDKPFNQQRYIDDYKKEHYDRLNIFLPKGYKDEIQRLARSKSMSVSKFILDCLESQYKIGK